MTRKSSDGSDIVDMKKKSPGARSPRSRGAGRKKDTVRPETLPLVAIVGRPNVGKSTLINRICGKTEAIVHHEPMITRDRKYYRSDWNGKIFYLMDTGGIDLKSKQRMDVQVVMQAKKAIDESDIIIFLVDLREPVSLLDDEIASMLRKTDKEILLEREREKICQKLEELNKKKRQS